MQATNQVFYAAKQSYAMQYAIYAGPLNNRVFYAAKLCVLCYIPWYAGPLTGFSS